MKKSYDYMDGYQFEAYCAKLLRRNGFHRVEVTRGSGDQGIDILAYKKRKKYGIQCKCYSYYLGNKAVQEAYAGMKFYECDKAVVLTNQYFTNSAVALAEKTDVLLWNRIILNELRRLKKPFYLTLLGLCSAFLGAWILYLLYSTMGWLPLFDDPELPKTLYSISLFLGGLCTAFERGARLSVFCSILLYGSSLVLSFSLYQTLGFFSLISLILLLFNLLRLIKLFGRTAPL